MVGDTARAKEMYEKLLEREPHFPEPYYSYGRMLCDMGEKERGIELIEQSLEKRFTHLSVLQKDEVEKILEEVRNS
jgi:tetratricopeptide (TPR) repeat protein